MQNLFSIAESATDNKTIAGLKDRLHELEKPKQVAEGLLYDVADDDEEWAEIEQEILKFERWAESVLPLLTDETYVADYEEKRLAIRILGIRCIIFPTQGKYPFRYRVDATIPAIMKKLRCGWIMSEIVGPFKGGPGTYGW